MIYSLLGDLGVGSTDATNFVESTRADLQVKQEDLFAEFEEKKGAGLPVPSGQNRVNEVDKKFGVLKNLAARIGSRRVIVPDDAPAVKDDSDRFGIVALDSDAVPGVDICILPPRDPDRKKK